MFQNDDKVVINSTHILLRHRRGSIFCDQWWSVGEGGTGSKMTKKLQNVLHKRLLNERKNLVGPIYLKNGMWTRHMKVSKQ